MSENDGGPAFPYSALQPDEKTAQLAGTMYADNMGMSLRDYFAGQVLANVTIKDYVDTAKVAYAIADAMIRRRTT